MSAPSLGPAARSIDAPLDEAVMIARATLSRAAEPACIPLWAYVREVGPVDAVESIRRGRAPGEVLAAVALRFGSVDPHADLDAAARHGIRLVVPESGEWPHFAFAALERAGEARAAEYAGGRRGHAEHGEPIPPLALWVRGPADLSTLAVRSVGIVGARSVTSYGLHVAREFASGLARRGFDIVSGGAYGVDAAAHQAAFAADAVTVVVSAGGLDQPYPPSNADLFAEAARTGLVVSESPVGCAPRRRRFLTRNRIIAALSTGTVVVEASRRSGALNTAGHCFRLDRPVLAVPGPVTSAMSVGCHNLLRDERGPAQLATSVEDVVAVLGSAGDVPARIDAATGADRVRALLDGVDERARRVFDGFPARRPTTPDELAQACGMSVVDVIRSLPLLELAGLVVEVDGGFRIAPRPRNGASP